MTYVFVGITAIALILILYRLTKTALRTLVNTETIKRLRSWLDQSESD